MQPNKMIESIHRFLRSRAGTDANAGVLAALIEGGREIDAVVLETEKLKAQEQILNFSKLPYYLLDIAGHPVLIYPNEEREKYLDIRDDLRFGDSALYAGFTYAELEAVKDYMDASGADYKSSMDGGTRMSVLVAKKDKGYMDAVLGKLRKEIGSSIGERYLSVKNQCWANTVSQVSKALAADMAYLGSDGGQDGIWIDQEAAYVVTAQGSEVIPRSGPDFEGEVTRKALDALRGKDSPIKAFFGDDMEGMAYGVKGAQKAMRRSEALRVLGFLEVPTPRELAAIAESEINSDRRLATYTLLRMELCRTMRVEGIKKLSKAEKKEYQGMHAELVRQFAAEIDRADRNMECREVVKE